MTDNEYPPIADVSQELGVPLTQRKMPDLANHVPSRRISLEEAKARGWSLFWAGGGCRYGHDSAVYTSNPFRCVDCDRVKKGKEPLYPKIRTGNHYEKPRRPEKDSQPLMIATPVVKQPEPDSADKRFLDSYAQLRDLDAAARACGSTAANVVSRRSHNAVLDAAMTRLEADMQIPKLVPESPTFIWDDAKRARFVEAYIDSGSIAIARDAVKCTPSQLWREIDANAQFASALDDARVRATQVFEEIAHAQALKGNDRLLPLILKAERPDKYTERLSLDMNVNNLSEEQINARLTIMFMQFKKMLGPSATSNNEAIDAEIIPPAQLAAPAPAEASATEPTEETPSDDTNGDLL